MANAKPVTAKAEATVDDDPRVKAILENKARPADAGSQNVGPSEVRSEEVLHLGGHKIVRTNH